MSGADRAVLDAFLAGVEQRALRMARVATRDRDEALDLVQDAMFRWVRRYAGHPAEQWAPLFYRCVQNRVRDWQRRQWLRQRLFFRTPVEEPDLLPLDVPDPVARDGADEVQRVQALGRLESALRSLPVRQREVFELRVWEGLDVRATALAMRCSEGSVKTHLSRALAALRAGLEDVWT